MAHLRLSFFGMFQATLDGVPITNFRSSRVKGLLIFLGLTAGQAHAREELAFLFWPDEPDRVARKNLRQSLYRLRRFLGETGEEDQPFLLISRSAVQFNASSDYQLDAADFLSAWKQKELEAVIHCYQGDLLPSFGCDSDPFDDWLREERDRLQRIALDALFMLAAQRLEHAEYEEAESLARQQLALKPWREEAHRQLMLALTLQGYRSAALSQYDLCRTVLREELGVEPAAQTQSLADTIARHRPTATIANPPAAGSDGLQPTSPFVGRRAELAHLFDGYQRVAYQGLQVVTLVGHAGIGKTRLAQEFLRWVATQGGDVLHGRAYETSTDLSYQPIIQLFRRRLERENAPDDLLSDLWLSQLTRLWPELRERYPDLPEAMQENSVARQHLYEAIARLGQALAARAPLILFIDDCQWLDAASLDVLRHAIVRWTEEQRPIFILLTLRQEALTESTEPQRWLTQLRDHPGFQQFVLGRLSDQETRQLVDRVLAAERNHKDTVPADHGQSSLDRLTDWLFAETDGQPLFLTEMLKALVDEGTVARSGSDTFEWTVDWNKLQTHTAAPTVWPGVQEIVRGWLARLNGPARALVEAAAVLVEEATFDHLHRVAGLDELAAITALDELRSRQILLETDKELLSLHHDPVYQFSHQKISDAVYAERSAARRRILHRTAFETLQASNASPAALAYHALHAGLVAETIRYSLIAGNEALSVFAGQIAANHYETAFRVGDQKGWPEAISGADRQALYVGLGRAYEQSEKIESARSLYESMIAFAQQVGAPAMECQAYNLLSDLYNMALFDPRKALTLLERAREVAEQAGDRRGMAETLQNLSMTVGHLSDLENEVRYARQAYTIACELGHPALLARCLYRLCMAYADVRAWEKAERYAAEAAQRFEEVGNLWLAHDTRRLLGACQMQNGRLQESLETQKAAYAFFQRSENVWEQANAASFFAMIHIELGIYEQGVRFATEAVELARAVEHPHLAVLHPTLGLAYRSILSLDVALETYRYLKELIDTGQIFYPFPDEIPAELCAVHALRGEWNEAYPYAKEALAFHTGGSLPPMGKTGWFETEALLRGGDGDLARAEIDRLDKVVGDNRRFRLPLLRSRAVLAQWDGAPDQAIAHLDAALALARAIGLPGEEWPILAALGALHVEQGEKERAQEAYETATAVIGRLAGMIGDSDLRAGYLAADPVRAVLDRHVAAPK